MGGGNPHCQTASEWSGVSTGSWARSQAPWVWTLGADLLCRPGQVSLPLRVKGYSVRNRDKSLCRCPNNALLFISSWRKEVTWPKRTSSGWNKTFLEHALVPCSSHQAAKHKAVKLYQGLSEMKGCLPKGWAPHMPLRDPLGQHLGCLSTLPSGQAGQRLLFHSTSALKRV